jgi:hypothetical protein
LKLWKNESCFKSGADANIKDNDLDDTVVQAFMLVSERCTERNYKKRCTMEEVFAASFSIVDFHA